MNSLAMLTRILIRRPVTTGHSVSIPGINKYSSKAYSPKIPLINNQECNSSPILSPNQGARLSLQRHSSHSQDSLISGKRVLVTGASRGIGRHLALHYARLGANLVITARDEQALAGVIEVCRQISGDSGVKDETSGGAASAGAAPSSPAILEYVVGAQGTPEEAQALIDRAAEILGGRLDILFLNHGLSAQSLWKGTPEQLHAAKSAMEVNYFSQMYLTSAALPLLKEAEGGGSVVVVNSASARSPMPSFSYYGASKSAMATFFRTLRLEFQQTNVDVSVTVCTLGLVKTERNIGKETTSLAFRLGAEPEAAAEFMILSAAKKKPEVKYPLVQFLVKDVIDSLPPQLRKAVMQKAVPKSH